MKDEYDFSNGVRGKFYRADARLSLPVYLDEDVLTLLRARAEAEGLTVSELVAKLLARDPTRANTDS